MIEVNVLLAIASQGDPEGIDQNEYNGKLCVCNMMKFIITRSVGLYVCDIMKFLIIQSVGLYVCDMLKFVIIRSVGLYVCDMMKFVIIIL